MSKNILKNRRFYQKNVLKGEEYLQKEKRGIDNVLLLPITVALLYSIMWLILLLVYLYSQQQ